MHNVKVQCSFEACECICRPVATSNLHLCDLCEPWRAGGPPNRETRERPLLPPKLFSPPLFARSFLRGDFSLHLSLSLGSKWSAKREGGGGGGERRRRLDGQNDSERFLFLLLSVVMTECEDRSSSACVDRATETIITALNTKQFFSS